MAIIERPPAGPSPPSSARSRRRPPEVLTEPEAIALIKACSSRAPTGVRNRALIAVLWRSGLRISEALALELRDIDMQAGTLRVRHGKGDKSRTVGVDEQTSALLARWLDRRRRLSPGAGRRCSAPWPAAASTRPMFATCCRAWRPRPAWIAACTPTACGTPTRQSWRGSAPRST